MRRSCAHRASGALDTLSLRAPLQRVPAVDDAEPWQRARLEGWEAVIAKRLDSTYEQRRSKHWLKMKCETSQPQIKVLMMNFGTSPLSR